MKIWAISKEGESEREIGIECDASEREAAMADLYKMPQWHLRQCR